MTLPATEPAFTIVNQSSLRKVFQIIHGIGTVVNYVVKQQSFTITLGSTTPFNSMRLKVSLIFFTGDAERKPVDFISQPPIETAIHACDPFGDNRSTDEGIEYRLIQIKPKVPFWESPAHPFLAFFWFPPCNYLKLQ
jgi:hypothetical protein